GVVERMAKTPLQHFCELTPLRGAPIEPIEGLEEFLVVTYLLYRTQAGLDGSTWIPKMRLRNTRNPAVDTSCYLWIENGSCLSSEHVRAGIPTPERAREAFEIVSQAFVCRVFRKCATKRLECSFGIVPPLFVNLCKIAEDSFSVERIGRR